MFAPLRLYVDGAPHYEYGREGGYPVWLNDPPIGLAIIKLPEGGGEFSMRVEHESLTQRSALSIPAFLIGDNAALIDCLFQTEGFSRCFPCS